MNKSLTGDVCESIMSTNGVMAASRSSSDPAAANLFTYESRGSAADTFNGNNLMGQLFHTFVHLNDIEI